MDVHFRVRLLGAAAGSRQRALCATLPPNATSAHANCSTVHAGASCGLTKLGFEARFFAGIALPHRVRA
jgi:hypothetical protein